MSEQEAHNTATNAERLEELSADPALRIIVASNPAAPAHLLDILAQDQDETVRQAVASNPNTPWPTLESLAWEFPRAFLDNLVAQLQIVAHPEQIRADAAFWGRLLQLAVIPSLWWKWLLNHSTLNRSQAVRLHVLYAAEISSFSEMVQEADEPTLLTLMELLSAACAQGTSLPCLPGNTSASQGATICSQIMSERLRWLAQSRNEKVRAVVASNISTPLEVLRNLAKDDEAEVRGAVAWNPQVPVEVLKILAQDMVPSVRAAVLENEQVSEETLKILAQDTEVGIREEVAKLPQTPREVFQLLAQDHDGMVRMRVASNVQAPVEVLEVLAQDTEAYVRTHVVRNAQTPGKVLLALAQDAEEGIIWELATNVQTPVEVLLALAQDRDERVRQAVARNSHTPREVLRRLAQDRDAGVRTGVAEHLQVPTEMFSLLAQDQDEEVRQAVARNGQTPTEHLSALAQDASRKVRRSANIVQRLLDEIEGPWHEQKWREKLREFLVFLDRHDEKMGDTSLERHLEWIGTHLGSQDIPDSVRQVVLAALAIGWDATKIQAAFVLDDETEVATIFPVRRYSYRHLLASFMPPIALQKLATSPLWDVRFLVALHGQTPQETRQQLSQDGNRYVRAIAQAKLEAREKSPQDLP